MTIYHTKWDHRALYGNTNNMTIYHTKWDHRGALE